MTLRPTVICLVGPTACHKTEVSIALAKRFHGEIVSADSVAVYRGLDIGSAKPSVSERAGVPHHMIDVAEITDTDFSVAQFRKEAREAIDSILSRGKLPIVVGGSGLYSDAIFSDMRFSVPSDSQIRSSLEKEYADGIEPFFARLKRVDPVTAARLHPNDKKRVVRAMEVYEVSGKPFSDWNESFQKAQMQGKTYRVLRYGLDMDRAKLYDRIERRVDRMFDAGLKEEAYSLFEKGLTPDQFCAMQSIGYAQLYTAYCGYCTEEEAKKKIKLDTRHFAKRQLTWFRRNPGTKWFRVEADSSMDEIISEMEKDIRESL